MTKTCKDCGDTYPKVKKHFYFTTNGHALARCKECHKAYTAEKLWESRERDKLNRSYNGL